MLARLLASLSSGGAHTVYRRNGGVNTIVFSVLFGPHLASREDGLQRHAEQIVQYHKVYINVDVWVGF